MFYPAFLCAGHGSTLVGLKSPAGRDERNCKLKSTAIQRCMVGRKLEAKAGLDEQESDTRPISPGKGAIDSEARYSFVGDKVNPARPSGKR